MLSLSCYISALLLSGTISATIGASAETGRGANSIIPLDEIRSGMTGYGLSVFKGTKIEPFPIEVVSVMHNAGGDLPVRPKRGVIWIRCTGPRMQKTGAVAGMSGSPIYIWSDDEEDELGKGGRLIGAFAYAYPFSKDCYAGVQPIEQMRGVGERANQQDSDTPSTRSVHPGIDLHRLLSLADSLGVQAAHTWRAAAMARLWPAPPTDDSSPAHAQGSLRPPTGFSGSARPMMLPIAVPSTQIARLLTPLMEPMRMVAVQGPPGVVTSRPPAEIDPATIRFEPGSVVALPLIFGDVDLSSAGTVTDVLPDGRILAFGHGMSSRGQVALPMATGYVHFIMPTLSVSFKMTGSAMTKGAFIRDEVSSVVGDPSGQVSTCPVQVKVAMSPGSVESHQYYVVLDRRITPIMAAITALISLTAERQLPEENTLRLKADMAFAGNRKLRIDTTIAAASAVSPVFELLPPIASMMDNPFESMTLESLNMEIDVEAVLRSANFIAARLENPEVTQGGQIGVILNLQPYGGPVMTKRLQLTVPEHLPDGDYPVSVSGASNYLKQLLSSRPHLLAITDADELHDMIQRMLDVDTASLYMMMKIPNQGLALGRTELPRLPSSRRALMAVPSSTLATTYTDLVVAKTPMPYVTQGQLAFTVRVRRDLKRS